MKLYLDLIRTDLIMMNGGKSSLMPLAVMILLFGIAGGLLLDPLIVVICMFVVSVMAAPMIFQLQSKNNCERLYAVLPIGRKHIVTARFLFMAAVYLALCIIMFAVMKISFAMKIFANFGFYDKMIAALGLGISYEQVVGMLFFVAFAAGSAVTGMTLKEWFTNTDHELLGGAHKKMNPKTVIAVLLFIALYIIIMLYFTDVLPMNAAAAVVLQLIMQLVTAAGGVLFSAAMIALGALSGIYSYICTVLEYNEKDI